MPTSANPYVIAGCTTVNRSTIGRIPATIDTFSRRRGVRSRRRRSEALALTQAHLEGQQRVHGSMGTSTRQAWQRDWQEPQHTPRHSSRMIEPTTSACNRHKNVYVSKNSALKSEGEWARHAHMRLRVQSASKTWHTVNARPRASETNTCYLYKMLLECSYRHQPEWIGPTCRSMMEYTGPRRGRHRKPAVHQDHRHPTMQAAMMQQLDAH